MKKPLCAVLASAAKLLPSAHGINAAISAMKTECSNAAVHR